MVKTGAAFGENIISEPYFRRSAGNGDSNKHPRDFFLPFVFILVFALLFLRVAYLQVVKGSYYRALSDSNRTKTVVIHAPRGIIFDRFGKPLVYNTPGFRETIKGKTQLIPAEKALDMIANGKKDLEIDTLRQYPYKDEISHVLGYLGQISPNQLKDPLYADYLGTDIVGQDGIEQSYEQKLKGIDGKQLFEINAQGNTVRKLGQNEPVAGENVTLTIDLDLQRKTFEAMKDVKKGAAIVQVPKGGVLALVSKPSFDPNLFTLGEGYKTATDSAYTKLEQVLLDGQNQPLLNRVISGVYPPGSTFKVVVASAALKNKIIDKNYTVNDTGIIKLGEFSFSNWYYTQYGGTDGAVNVVKGIKRSNDIFFYTLAGKTGIDTISNTAAKYGVGSQLGIDLAGEAKGILPTVEWKEKNIGETWYLGDTYHYGIGQGYLLTTPLQVNSWTLAIANEGVLYRPHLLKNAPNQVISSSLLDANSFNLIRQGMIEACQTGGVAWPLFNFTVKNPKLKIDNKNILPAASSSAQARQVVVACKTGTAENGGPTTAPHAWITLFAPAYKPEIIVTVLSENSGEGSNVAGPIAKKILDAYFSK